MLEALAVAGAGRNTRRALGLDDDPEDAPFWSLQHCTQRVRTSLVAGCQGRGGDAQRLVPSRAATYTRAP